LIYVVIPVGKSAGPRLKAGVTMEM